MILYGLNGGAITSSIGFCQDFGEQPPANGIAGSFVNINADYNNLINTIYEPLRTQHPNYITRKSLGKDASGLYDMWAYTFEPRYYKQSILLVAGIHANEPDAVACLGRIMQMIVNESGKNDALAILRHNVKITVVPCVNVWGFSQSTKQRLNVNGDGMQKFTVENPAQEVVNMKSFIAEIKDELSFMIDMHTTTVDHYNDFYGIISQHAPNVRTIFRVNSWLCQNYGKTSKSTDDQWLGYYGTNDLLSNYMYSLGVPSSTLELSDYHWDNNLSTAKVITIGVTMWLNYIVQQVLDEYKTIEDIPDEDYRPSKG